MRHALTLLATVASVALGARLAAADPPEPRLFTAPTAWLPPAGALTASAQFDPSTDSRDDGGVMIGYSLGGIAAVDLGADTEIRTCTSCDRPANGRWFPRASFRIGSRQHALFRGMPALVLGLKNTFAPPDLGRLGRPRVTEAYVAASSVVGPVRLHAGVMVFAAEFADLELEPELRPFAGIELRPPGWPRSHFMADVAWTTRLELEPEPSVRRGPQLEAMIGGGARYQFFEWAAIELGFRVPQDEGLASGRVLIRLSGVWELDSPAKKRLKVR